MADAKRSHGPGLGTSASETLERTVVVWKAFGLGGRRIAAGKVTARLRILVTGTWNPLLSKERLARHVKANDKLILNLMAPLWSAMTSIFETFELADAASLSGSREKVMSFLTFKTEQNAFEGNCTF
jgi:hypothetical protein